MSPKGEGRPEAIRLEPTRDWLKGITSVVASQVKHFQRARSPKMTVTALAKAAGIARPVLSNLLNGERESISVVEVFLLSEALNVAPLDLLVPFDEADVELLPGRRIPTDVAASWIVNGPQYEDNGPPDSHSGRLLMHANLVNSCTIGFEKLEQHLQSNIGGRGYLFTSPDATRSVAERLRFAVRGLGGTRETIRESGAMPPHLPELLKELEGPDGEKALTARVDRLEKLVLSSLPGGES